MPPRISKTLAYKFGAEYHELRGAGHFPHIENEADKNIEAILDIVENIRRKMPTSKVAHS